MESVCEAVCAELFAELQSEEYKLGAALQTL